MYKNYLGSRVTLYYFPLDCNPGEGADPDEEISFVSWRDFTHSVFTDWQFMDRFLGHLQGMSDGPRMLYRSRHIFILLSGLVHLLIGTYFQYRTGSWRRFLQLLGSILLTLSSVLLIVAFFKEPVMTGLRVPFSQNGIYLAAAGALLHWLASMATNEVRRITNNDLGTEPN